eukprot:CAMPEP_0203672146 /NCGR_PEP_ID=MMETSP0090-20130426/7735_1 /ASSEMBLY_ACC=CAM_ASM_001088 /TAXON_ID=426623 /ORGANISM="Chaetoceros affinis, Strain CCMP159" /LENGTH=725 /DNA_ID=CAMNT_0050537399 /DNA_START=586 /DNA_END=2763 /DNA_ORIENTATION=+
MLLGRSFTTFSSPISQTYNYKPKQLLILRAEMSSSSSSTSTTPESDDKKETKSKENNNKNNSNSKKKKKRKITLADPSKVDVEALSAAFDEMAKKDGFDASTAFYTDDATFEDEFDYDLSDDGDSLNINDGEDDDDDFIDFGSDFDDNVGGGMSMEERINAAQRDMDLGRVSVPEELESFASNRDEVTRGQLQKLGFVQEINPFGNDETPRKEAFKLITDAMVCSACGSKFQSTNESKPGFLPQQKFEVQTKLARIEQVQKIQEKATSDEWSPEDEVEWLIQSGGVEDPRDGENIDINTMAEELGLDLLELTKEKKTICKRCHGLQNFGEAPEMLRPGWTDEPMLSQEKFRNLLLPLREKPAVIIALVDLFDFSGSILPELDAIAGDNPVIVAANKADLLPSKMGQTRAENWVRRELEYLGVQSIANIGGAVRLVSCKTGFGVSQMLAKARGLAEDMDCDIFVVGAANAGKSTLVNHILAKNDKSSAPKMKKRAGNANARKGAVTASPLPGTTLEFIKIDIGHGQTLFDTPGLLVPNTLTQRLTPAELKMVVPRKQVEPITFRVASGKAVLVGGLAKIEVIGDSKPFLFTFFVSNDVKLHPTDSSKADEFIAKHAGKILSPPLEPGPERMEQIGEFEYHDIEIEGDGWKEAAADISLRGLGWVAVTGPGTARVRVGVPKGIGFSVRPPLMPFDIWEATAKYTGGRAVRKSTKTKAGKRNKGVGRR